MAEEEESTKRESMLPLRMISKVVRGFGRGSSDLGIPTANLDRNLAQTSAGVGFDDLPTGIYWGFCRIGEKKNGSDTVGVVYKTAVSIGYNPTYGNDTKTVEPHLIAPAQDPRRHASSCGETVLQEFYDQPVRLSVVGYLRPELPFEGLPKLIEAIKNDIVHAEKLADGDDTQTLAEKQWVETNDPL